MTKDEARLYLNLLDGAWQEGLSGECEIALGRKLRDEFFPGEYHYIFEPMPITDAIWLREPKPPPSVLNHSTYPLRLGPEQAVPVSVDEKIYWFKEEYPIVFANESALIDAAESALNAIAGRGRTQGLVVVGPEDFVAQYKREQVAKEEKQSAHFRACRIQRALARARERQ